MERHDNQPEWLDDLVGMESYGVEITDAYLANKERFGTHHEVVMLETTSTHHRKGYWYYSDSHDEWYWSIGGGPPQVANDAFNEVISKHEEISAR